MKVLNFESFINLFNRISLSVRKNGSISIPYIVVLHSLFNSVNRIFIATLLLIENIEEALKTNYIIIRSRKISYNTFILKNNNQAKKSRL